MPRAKGQQILGHTRENYDRLVEAYRSNPGLHARVAALVGVDYKTAKRAWEDGWDAKQCPWAQPILHVLAEEQEAARAGRAVKEIEIREREAAQAIAARADAIEARAEEAVGAKRSRQNAIGVATIATRLVMSMQKLTLELNIRTGVIDPKAMDAAQIARAAAANVAGMSMAEIKGMLALGATLVERSQRILRMALDIERVVAGDPQAIIEVRNAEGLSPQEVASELNRIGGVLERARLRYRPIEIPAEGQVVEGDEEDI